MSDLDKTLTKCEIPSGILTLDANYILTAVNAQYLHLTGFNEEDLLGSSIKDIDKYSAEKIQSNNGNTTFGHFNSTLQRKFVDINLLNLVQEYGKIKRRQCSKYPKITSLLISIYCG